MRRKTSEADVADAAGAGGNAAAAGGAAAAPEGEASAASNIVATKNFFFTFRSWPLHPSSNRLRPAEAPDPSIALQAELVCIKPKSEFRSCNEHCPTAKLPSGRRSKPTDFGTAWRASHGRAT